MIRLAFANKAPGRGVIRARVYSADGAQILTVGNYGYRQGAGDWIARLWAKAGKPSPIIPDGIITAPDVPRLSNIAAARGEWWT